MLEASNWASIIFQQSVSSRLCLALIDPSCRQFAFYVPSSASEWGGGGDKPQQCEAIPNLWLLRPRTDPETGKASVGVSASSAPSDSNIVADSALLFANSGSPETIWHSKVILKLKANFNPGIVAHAYNEAKKFGGGAEIHNQHGQESKTLSQTK